MPADDFSAGPGGAYHLHFVNLSPSALLAHARTDAGKRAIRYSATSLICVAFTQVLILVFYRGFKYSPIRSNLSATMITSIPAFALNKYWVWGKWGRAHMRREVLPFWAFTVAGWALSTGAVSLADGVGDEHSTVRTLSVMIASIAGFGILWVLKYLFLDKIMCGPDHHTPYDEDIEVEEAALEATSPSAQS